MGASAELPYSSCGACDDDEPGSPWTIVLYVDERGSDEQREGSRRSCSASAAARTS